MSRSDLKLRVQMETWWHTWDMYKYQGVQIRSPCEDQIDGYQSDRIHGGAVGRRM